jgi:2-succinyl-6-hydroxy-2,4-cyclohexadiene-1-carboxylate synthase
MEFKNFLFENIRLSYILKKGKDKSKIPLILLNGFSGSAEDWIFFLNNIPNDITAAALNIIGHGKSDSPKNGNFYNAGSIALQIKTLIEELGFEKVILIGYSMGGRAALSFASKFPERVSAMILESTSFGIKNEKERKNRIKEDARLAEFILAKNIETFVDYWLSLPLFNSLKNLPPEKFQELKKSKLQNSKTGLANILKEFSTGKMPYFLNNPEIFNFPVLLISGELDKKYKSQNEKAVKIIPHSTSVVIPNAGHNVHLEKPEEFINFTHKFLESIWKENEI